MCRLRVVLLLLAGCDHRLPPGPAGDASSSLPPPAALPGSSGGAPDRPVPSKTELPPTLRHFFAGYTDRSDFEFMRADCRPIMDRFVTLQNVEVGAAIRDARSFFRDKHDLAYSPDLKRIRAEPHAGGTTVRLPVTMSWTYPIPKEWGPDWPAWGTKSPAVARSVTVDVEIEVDADGRIARYVETHVESPWLRVTGSDECVAADDSRPTPWMDLKKGTLVRDLGETVIVGVNTKGADTARKVRAKGGDGWTMDNVSFAIENPAGGSSAGAESCLDPVGDAGAP